MRKNNKGLANLIKQGYDLNKTQFLDLYSRPQRAYDICLTITTRIGLSGTYMLVYEYKKQQIERYDKEGVETTLRVGNIGSVQQKVARRFDDNNNNENMHL